MVRRVPPALLPPIWQPLNMALAPVHKNVHELFARRSLSNQRLSSVWANSDNDALQPSVFLETMIRIMSGTFRQDLNTKPVN